MAVGVENTDVAKETVTNNMGAPVALLEEG